MQPIASIKRGGCVVKLFMVSHHKEWIKYQGHRTIQSVAIKHNYSLERYEYNTTHCYLTTKPLKNLRGVLSNLKIYGHLCVYKSY